MGIVELIPWVFLVVGAVRIGGRAKSSGRMSSGTALTVVWILLIAVPVIFQAAMVRVFSPGLRVTAFHWFLIDTFGMRLGNAAYVVDAFWRTVGVIVGFIVVNAIVANGGPGGSRPAISGNADASAGAVPEGAIGPEEGPPGDRGGTAA